MLANSARWRCQAQGSSRLACDCQMRSPGGNITGVSTFLAETEPKRLELLRELRPYATTTAVLVNPKNIQQAEIQVSDIQTAARSVGQQITVLNASTISGTDLQRHPLNDIRGFASKVGRRAPTARYIKAQGKREARRPGFTTSTRDRGLKGRNTQGITPFQGWNV